MRRVDRLLGVPACCLLTLQRRCREAIFRRSAADEPPRRILFVKLAEQGATVLAYPAIHRAVEMVGRENVYFLVFAENRFILDVMEVIPAENVIAIPTGSAPALVAGLAAALARLRRLAIDAAIDLEFFARGSAVLTYLSGAGKRVGLHRFGDQAPYRGDLMTHRLKYDPHLHTEDAFAAMVEALDETPETCSAGPAPGECRKRSLATFPEFSPRPEELAEVRALVAREARSDEFLPLVLLNANASDLLPLRRWLPDRYVALARRLIQGHSRLRIAFTGAPDEAAAAAELAAAVGSDRCFSLAGRTSLRQLLVLYCLADVLVTNDSGPAHFATLTPIRVVTLFGPETPALFGARSPRTEIIYRCEECSPCVSAYNNRLSTCRDNRCMQKITVDEVFAATERALAARPAVGDAEPLVC